MLVPIRPQIKTAAADANLFTGNCVSPKYVFVFHEWNFTVYLITDFLKKKLSGTD